MSEFLCTIYRSPELSYITHTYPHVVKILALEILLRLNLHITHTHTHTNFHSLFHLTLKTEKNSAMSDEHFLKGKTAIVTGGSGTIGKAIAKGLLLHGCNVFITGRNQARLASAAAELTVEGANYGKMHTFSGDVCNEQDVVHLFDAAIDAYSGVDLLVNNAGTAIPGKTIETSAADFNKVMEVNVTGPFVCAKEAMRRMKDRGNGGRIINMGSISAYSPRPDGASYTASKFALMGLSHSLSLDCRQYGIAVGIIHPGNVVSNLLAPEIFAEREASEGFMNAEDVASCVIAMAQLNYHANVLEMTVTPIRQPLVGRG